MGRRDPESAAANYHLLIWCVRHKITFTRSRPCNSNDGAHVEQKNWARVRELVGYYRYDTKAERDLLNAIWTSTRSSPTTCCPNKN